MTKADELKLELEKHVKDEDYSLTSVPNCRLRICPGGVYNDQPTDAYVMTYRGKLPNVFHRWMQRVLLGFYWEKI